MLKTQICVIRLAQL